MPRCFGASQSVRASSIAEGGGPGAGRPDLLAAHDPLVPVALGPGGEPGQVRSVAGLARTAGTTGPRRSGSGAGAGPSAASEPWASSVGAARFIAEPIGGPTAPKRLTLHVGHGGQLGGQPLPEPLRWPLRRGPAGVGEGPATRRAAARGPSWPRATPGPRPAPPPESKHRSSLAPHASRALPAPTRARPLRLRPGRPRRRRHVVAVGPVELRHVEDEVRCPLHDQQHRETVRQTAVPVPLPRRDDHRVPRRPRPVRAGRPPRPHRRPRAGADPTSRGGAGSGRPARAGRSASQSRPRTAPARCGAWHPHRKKARPRPWRKALAPRSPPSTSPLSPGPTPWSARARTWESQMVLPPVKALVFDVFGTVVDWRTASSRQAETAGRRRRGRRGLGLVRRRLAPGGLSRPDLRDRHGDRARIADVEVAARRAARGAPRPPPVDLDDRAAHELPGRVARLEPWPDAREGLERLRRRLTSSPRCPTGASPS